MVAELEGSVDELRRESGRAGDEAAGLRKELRAVRSALRQQQGEIAIKDQQLEALRGRLEGNPIMFLQMNRASTFDP